MIVIKAQKEHTILLKVVFLKKLLKRERFNIYNG